MHGMVRWDTLEAHGKRLNVPLVLEEGRRRNREASGWVQISNVRQALSLLACDFVSHDNIKYVKPKRINLRAATELTGQPSQFLTSESSFLSFL